ncbi:MAG: hypothetical protein HY711_08920 [Candidatus Melainabacteria bacterium]|nr:hypothetical protein [Candidatus Melainabacteria bacterium]
MHLIDVILMLAGVLVIVVCSLEIAPLRRRVEYLFCIAVALTIAGLLVQSELIIYEALLVLLVCFVVKEQIDGGEK